MEKTTVYTIQEAITELQRQRLLGQDWYAHNYRLLNNIEDYLDKCDKGGNDFDEAEQIYNYLAYDLNWLKNKELFPMEL